MVSVAGYAVFHYYKGQLGTIDLGLHGKNRPAASADGSAQNFLLVGSDTRDFAGGKQFQGSGADFVTGQRSDTVMLAHIPAGKARATIVSFPRDSWVEVPSYTDGQGHQHAAHMAKLNSAFALGGPRLLVQVIENLSGLRVDHYVQVDFAGFKNMVDALGGVNLCIGTTRHDKDSGDFLTAGMHNGVDGSTALAFVRDRKGLPRGDIDRIADQQYFLAQMLKKVLSAGTLANPFKINGFLQALTKSVTVDSDFGFSSMQTLALRLRHLDPAHVAMITIPITTDAGWRDGQSVVLIDDAAANHLFTSLRNESQSSPAKTQPPKVTVPPSDVQVVVLNATARSGLARSTGDALAAESFHVDRFGNAETHTLSRTVVRYSEGHKDAAKTVAAATGATLKLDNTVGDAVTLVLGGDFTQVHALAGAPAPRSAPTSGASASPAPPPQTAATAACAP